MNKYISKILITAALYIIPHTVYGLMPIQQTCSLKTDTPLISPAPHHKKPISRKGRAWIPDNIIFQYAGSIGLCSAGIGWEYGHRHWETALIIGLVPKAYERPAMPSLTIKQQYTPWRIRLPKNLYLQPLHCGLFINSILNEHFWGSEPGKYPNGYYGFSTRIRFHIFLSESLSYKLPDRIRFGNEVSIYYELSSCDLYIISAATNKYLKPKDYLSLAFGMKWHF